MMPWKRLANHQTFIFGWLNGYAAVLGPVAGIMICDYFVIRRKRLVSDDLYLRGGAYEYSRGFNLRALAALAAAPVWRSWDWSFLPCAFCTTTRGSWVSWRHSSPIGR